MLNDLEQITFKAGDFIFKEGDPPGGVYLISKGKVEISKTKEGQKLVLAERGFNDIFGEMALVDSEDRSASAQAIEDTHCYMLDEAAFNERLRSADQFIQGVIKVLVKTIRSVTDGQVKMKMALTDCDDETIKKVISAVPPILSANLDNLLSAENKGEGLQEEKPENDEPAPTSSTTGF